MKTEEKSLPQSDYSTIQRSLNRYHIPYTQDFFNGMAMDVETDLVEVIEKEPAILEYYVQEADSVRIEALAHSGPNPNNIIAEFVAYEPFRHIGIIKKGIEMSKNGSKSGETQDLNEMSLYHLEAARRAIESYNAYSYDKNPVELWNYYETVIAQLYEEVNRHQSEPEFIQLIIEDINMYKQLQDRIQLS